MVGYLSQSAATPLFHHLSLCSFFHFSVRMSDQSIPPSILQTIPLSVCQMSIYLSSAFLICQASPPSLLSLPLWGCVFCVCTESVNLHVQWRAFVCLCAFQCAHGYVGVCVYLPVPDRYLSLIPPPSLPH